MFSPEEIVQKLHDPSENTIGYVKWLMQKQGYDFVEKCMYLAVEAEQDGRIKGGNTGKYFVGVVKNKLKQKQGLE